MLALLQCFDLLIFILCHFEVMSLANQAPDQATHDKIGLQIMNPAQGVQADIELTCVIANDHGVGEKAMGFDAPPQRTFGGDQYRIGSDLEGRDAERVEMGVPGGLVGEISVGMIEKAGDHRASQRSLAHVSDRLVVNHIIAVAGTQQFKEVEAALGARGAEPSEVACGVRRCRPP
jgi:hypothetical protein